MYFFVVFFSKIAYNILRTVLDHRYPRLPMGAGVYKSVSADQRFAVETVRSPFALDRFMIIIEYICILRSAMRAFLRMQITYIRIIACLISDNFII